MTMAVRGHIGPFKSQYNESELQGGNFVEKYISMIITETY